MLFPDGVRAVNVGLDMFAQPLAANGASVSRLDWRPPAEGDRDVGLLLARLEDDPDDPIGRRIAAANATAVDRLLAAQPMLVDVQPARVALGLGDRHILHAGPPIAWQRMCGPVEGAIIGAILFEGWASVAGGGDRARRIGRRRALAVPRSRGPSGPMAGVISPSMPVVVVENVASGTRAHATLNEGLGKVLRFGAYDASVLDRLRWFVDVLGPALSSALQQRRAARSAQPHRPGAADGRRRAQSEYRGDLAVHPGHRSGPGANGRYGGGAPRSSTSCTATTTSSSTCRWPLASPPWTARTGSRRRRS